MRLAQSAHPEGISTSEVARILLATFGLTFVTSAARNRWRRHSVRNALCDLERAGKVRKTGLKGAANSDIWVVVAPRDATLAEIKRSARAANVAVIVPTELATPDFEGA